jgi:hypothetical protein
MKNSFFSLIFIGKKVKSKPKPIREESSISLATKIYLAEPEHPEIKDHCKNLWKKFETHSDPRSLISLASTIKLEHSHAPCRKYLETKVGTKLKNYFAVNEKLPPIRNIKNKNDYKLHFLLLLAHDPDSARMKDLDHLLAYNPGVVEGNFFRSATPHQNVILRSLFCNSIGRTIVRNGIDKKPYTNPETYIGKCYEKESKRAFLLARVKRDTE